MSIKGIFKINVLTKKDFKNNILTEVIFSKCYTYRYSYKRTWNLRSKNFLFILLNPSTASESKNDSTITRLEKHVRNLDGGSFTVCNLFALREKSPKKLKIKDNPIGDRNEYFIKKNSSMAHKIICAWGNEGKYLNQAKKIKKMLIKKNYEIFIFGLTKKNEPSHPLYLSYNIKIKRWF